MVRLDGSGFEILRAGAYDEASLRRMAAVNLLFVCTGNTCRSPMAAATCERMLLERLGGDASALTAGEVSVRSCGVFASRNSGASPEAMEVMSRRGADLSGHRTQPLTAELIRQADHIYVMTEKHLERVVEIVPSAKDRCRLLSDGDIHDPIGGSIEVYAECADRIEASLRARLKEVDI